MSRSLWRWSNVPVPEAHVAALGAAGLARVILPLRVPIGRGTARAVGWPLVAAGTGLAAWGAASASAADVHVDRPTSLVTTGAFGVTRNPMYLGWSVAVVGLGIAARSAWVISAAAFATAATHRTILEEEAALSTAFGREFTNYAATTPRYLATQLNALGHPDVGIREGRQTARNERPA